MPKTNVCAYNGCSNSSRKNADLSFHRFPVDNNIRKEWIVRVQRSEWLQLGIPRLENQRICSEHFQLNDFINYDRTNGTRKLLLTAVPAANNFSVDPACEALQIPVPAQQTSETVLVTSVAKKPSNSGTVLVSRKKYQISIREQRLLKQILTLKYKLKKARQTVRNFTRRTTKKLSIPEIIEGAAQYIDGNRLLLLTMQLTHIKVSQWNEDEKHFALGLFYKSPKAYTYLRVNKNIALPCVTLIRQWINDVHLTTGISTGLFKLLETKAQAMTEDELQCVLMWDEMSIKRLLEYNPKDDLVEGFQDLGSLGRSNRVANYALVFLIRGLTYKWKQPVAFFISQGNVDGSKLTTIIMLVLDAVSRIGFVPRSMVCDQGSPNRRAIVNLGITEERPFIELSGSKVFFNYDVSHEIKSIRNNLYRHDFIIGGEHISWEAIRELRDVERNKPCRAAPKLTDRHIDPTNFQRMNVRLATQVFSASVSAAMTTGRMTGDLRHPCNIATANFIKRLNDIFDCLNSRYANDSNPLKRALSDKSPQVKDCLEKALPWLEQWTISHGPSPPCFAGLRLSIRSVLMFWSELRIKNTLYLLTTRLNQDALENQFSVLRSRSGHNDNPSAMQFRRNVQYVITIRLEKPPVGTNCEDDDTSVLLANNYSNSNTTDSAGQAASFDYSSLQIEDTEILEETHETTDETKIQVETLIDEKKQSNKVTLEECSIRYVAGYLLHKCFAKFSCCNCESLFVKGNQHLENYDEMLLFFKAYKTADGEQLGHLKAPVDRFHTLIVAAYRRFEKEFSSHAHKVNISKYLEQCIHETLTKTDSEYWLKNSHCQIHRDYIVNLFVRTHIFNHLKWISRDLRDATSRKHSCSKETEKPNRKLLKVTHS